MAAATPGSKIEVPNTIGPYTLSKYLGEGAFSVVRECTKEGNDEILACKVIPKTRMNTQKLMDRLEVEMRVNQQLHHPGIVQMMDMLCDKNNYYIIMELCKNGDLIGYLKEKKKLKESEAKPVFHQILETMAYLHHMRVAHRDMKPENILIDDEGKVKITDFGLSNFVNQDDLVTTPCGTAIYLSPECLSKKPYSGFTNDAWACGVILYYILTGNIPWTKKAQAQMFQQILKGEYSVPMSLSSEAKSLIKGLMTVDPAKRLTVNDALQHKWFKGMSQLYDLSHPKGYVSLRQVDIYFGKDIRDIKITDEDWMTTSVPEIGVRKTLKLLGCKVESRKRRRRKNSDEGVRSSRRHRHHKKVSHEDGASPSSSQQKAAANPDAAANPESTEPVRLPSENAAEQQKTETPESNPEAHDAPSGGDSTSPNPAGADTSPREHGKKKRKKGTGKKKKGAAKKRSKFQTYVMPISATSVSSDQVKSYQTIVEQSDDEDDEEDGEQPAEQAQ